jgi:hypothetical protein
MALIDTIIGAFSKRKTGKLQAIDLTFGGAGNQLMTINNIQYATWVDYTEWPKIGATVLHEPYNARDGRGGWLRATKIISWALPEEQA